MRILVRFKIISTLLMQVILGLCFVENLQAEQIYTPGQVYASVDYADRILNKVLASKGIRDIQLPLSKEKAVKPMHVYELHVSVLREIYDYELKNNRRPPSLAISTPIRYTPTDVYYLTQSAVNCMEEIYRDNGGEIDFSISSHETRTPAEVYQKLFEFYYNLNRLNGKSKVSPSEVYAHTQRAKEDLQSSLLILSKRLDDSEEKKKRFLVTAIYGIHPDGTVMKPLESGKKPVDVLEMAFEVRDKLNKLRTQYKLTEIKRPKRTEFRKIKPIDVFLQAQFIIAELNLLKIPMNIQSTTNATKPVSDKTPSDVYHEMKHIGYMLDRLLQIL